MTIRKSFKSKSKPQEMFCDEDMLEKFSPFKIGRIIPTKTTRNQNVFKSFRPKPGECLDYNISETFVKWDVRDTQINVKRTEASYVPVPSDMKPKRKKKIVYSHSGPPQWKFIDEIWREHRNQLQDQSKREFHQSHKKRKHKNNGQASTLHSLIQGMVGPEWFQELAPKQLKIVDQLKYCIAQDYKDKTIIHTKENIGSLGLVPRPNSKHIESALKFCCGIDVEFLLILYQLMKPNRTEYSINDRLLLSAVVHLTMTETLRELHIRIPSPPREKKMVPKIIYKRVIKWYRSPYLVPFVFKPEAPRYSGIYENKHIQYPENTYFSYIDALHQEMQFADNILNVAVGDQIDPVDLDVIVDMQNAQKVYNKLPFNTGRVNLMRPTIKKLCSDFQDYLNKHGKGGDDSFMPHLAELENTEEICTCLQPLDHEQDTCCELLDECDCGESCCCKDKSKLFLQSLCKRCLQQKQHKNARNIVIGIKMTKSNTVIPIIGGTFKEKQCECLLRYKEQLLGVAASNKLKGQKTKYIIGGVVLSPLGPTYLISNVSVKDVSKKTVELGESNPSTCVCKTDITCGKNYETESAKSCSPDDEGREDCECKKELEVFLRHKCFCEGCHIANVRENTTFILQGLKMISDEKTVDIIAGVRDQRCDCLNTYMNRMMKLEEYRSRIEARFRMKSQNKKYAISGVVSTPKGPVYCIGGVRSPIKCVCADVKKKREETEAALKRMAKMPPTGRMKYEISGVKHGSEENVFIISRALPVEDCPCEKLYQVYEKAHEKCLNTYEEYLIKIGKEMEEYNKAFEEIPPEELTPEKLTPEQLTPEKLIPEELIPEKSSPEKLSSEKIIPAKLTPEKPPSDRTEKLKYSNSNVEKLKTRGLASLLNLDQTSSSMILTQGLKAIKPTGANNNKTLNIQKNNQEDKKESNKLDGSGTTKLTSTEYNLETNFQEETLAVIEKRDSENNNERCYTKPTSEKYKEEMDCCCDDKSNGSKKLTSTKHRFTCPTAFEKVTCTTLDEEEYANDACDCQGIREKYNRKLYCADTNGLQTPLNNTWVSESESDIRNEKDELKRFVILSRVPCDRRKQVEILRKVLASMAEDGFPLAKLPDCYKLPHFRLWMELRCGRSWSQKDRVFYENFSQFLWKHTQACYQDIPPPTLNISKARANAFTWKNAKFCRKLIEEKNYMFQRQLKQQMVNGAREFFPLTFSYEFPTPTFRDCNFAYLPAKEEDFFVG